MNEFNNVNVIDWTIDSTSFKKLSTLDFSRSNVAIVTTYEHVKEEKMLAFVGSVPSAKLRDEAYVLLGLFLIMNIDPLEEEVNVQDFFQSCDQTKYNTNVGQSSGHHDSIGANFGIGSCQDYKVKENNSSVGIFSTKPNKVPEKQIVNEISKACAAVNFLWDMTSIIWMQYK